MRSWRSAYRHFAPPDYLDSLDVTRQAEYWREKLGRGAAGSVTWVAERGAEAVGFASTEAPLSDPRPDEEVPDGCGWLHHIHVSPESVGSGVGARLFGRALAALLEQGVAEAVLWVYGPNLRARGFYERMGYREDGARAWRIFPSSAGHVSIEQVRYRGPTRLAGPAG